MSQNHFHIFNNLGKISNVYLGGVARDGKDVKVKQVINIGLIMRNQSSLM